MATTPTTDTNYFYSVERSGYFTVSSLFLDVLADMVTGNAFNVINLSNSTDPGGFPYISNTLENYVCKIVVPNLPAAPVAVGTQYYIPGTPASYSTGIKKPQPYVLVTEVIDVLTNAVKSSGSGIIYSVSDIINGNIGTTATDWPLFADHTAMLGLAPPALPAPPDTFLQTSIDGGVTLIPSLIKVKVSLGTTPSIYSFTLEATAEIDSLNGLGYTVTAPGVGQNDDGNNRQPWRIQFVIPHPQQAQGSVAAPMQMSYDPVADRVTVAKITDDTGAIMDNVGSLGAWQPGGLLNQFDPKQGFINRKVRVADQARTYPLSYMLSISSHGFFLGVWEGNWSTQRAGVTKASNYFNWVAVQRPVNSNSGRTLTSGKSPVFAINGTDYLYYSAVVREADILHPSAGPSPIVGGGFIQISATKPYKITGTKDTNSGLSTEFTTTWEPGTVIYSPATGTNPNTFIGIIKNVVNDTTAYLTATAADAGVGNSPPSRYGLPNLPSAYVYLAPNQTPYRTYADRHSEGHHMLFSSVNQVALTEDKTYLLTFPHNLTTPRFRYTEEIDMFGTTSADVVRAGQDIQFVTYGEWGPRTYRALPASSRDNTGMRIAAMRAPTGPAWIGVQTVDGQANGTTMTAPLLIADPYIGFPVSALERDPTGTWTTTWINVDPMPAGGNLSALTDAINVHGPSRGDYLLYPNRPWTPINLVGYPIQKVRTTDFSHGPNVTYSITRGMEQLKALGLTIVNVNNDIGINIGAPLYWAAYVGQIQLDPAYINTGIVPVPYAQETIIPFTITVKNSLNDYETPRGQNSMDFYFVYNPIPPV